MSLYALRRLAFRSRVSPVRHYLCLFAFIAALVAVPRDCRSVDYHVVSAMDVSRIADKLQPGDSVIVADGPWLDQAISLKAIGTKSRPITLRAETPGKTVLGGRSSLMVDGEHIVISGLVLKNAGEAESGIMLKGRFCRLTESAVIDCTYKFYVRIDGVSNRMDHCYLAGKTSGEPTLQIEVGAAPNYDRIDHNLFGHRPPLGRNGGETMRVGYSFQSMSNSCCLVEQNLFDRCDGEIEIISNKSCRNVYRGNTFLECGGMFTLRHGNGCLVDGNFFIGHHKRGSGGFRVIGENHTIINNYIEGVNQGAFWITSGVSNSPLNAYFRARNCLIAFNTVVDCPGTLIRLNAGFGTARRTLMPEYITLANNLFVLSTGANLFDGIEGKGYRWEGNLVSGEAITNQTHAGVRRIEANLQRAGDGLLRPEASSPLQGMAIGKYKQVKEDMDGQPRKGAFDVGADQLSNVPIVNHPLTVAEVGPEWMKSIPDSKGAGAGHQ